MQGKQLIKRLKAKLNGDIHFKEILTGSAITFILKLSGMLLGYIVVLIISRRYGTEGIGVYNLTISIMTFVAMIAAMGMNISILRYVGQFNQHGEEYKLKLLYRYAVEFVIPFSLLLATLLYFLADVIAQKVFHNLAYKPALEFAAFIVPFMVLQDISVEYIRGLKQLKISEFLRSVSRPVVNIILLLILGTFVLDNLLPLYTLGIGIILSAGFAFYYIISKINKIKSASEGIFSKKELIVTSMPMMLITLSSFLLGNIGLYFLEIYTTTEQVGIFSTAFKISFIAGMSLMVINTIAAPKFSQMYWSNESEKLQKIVLYSSKINFIFSLTAATIIIIFSHQILSVFGSKFVQGQLVLIILTIEQFLNAVTGSAGVLLNMVGKQVAAQKIIFFTVIVSVIFNLILIPKYGMLGAALSVLISSIFMRFSNVHYVKKSMGINTIYVPNIVKRSRDAY